MTDENPAAGAIRKLDGAAMRIELLWAIADSIQEALTAAGLEVTVVRRGQPVPASQIGTVIAVALSRGGVIDRIT